MDTVISLQNLKKDYSLGVETVHALRGVTLEVTKGEFIAIMGASGSGKSTMLNLIGCLDRPSEGTYLLDGIDASKLSASERADIRNKKIGFIFQSFNLLPRTSVWENIEAPMLYAGLPRSVRDQRVRDALETVGISEKANALPNQLSGGQQQRVAVARALVNLPPLMLADEPTGNLDSVTAKEIMDFLKDLNIRKKITLVMVTHEADIAAYAQRIVQMKDGLIQSDKILRNKFSL